MTEDSTIHNSSSMMDADDEMFFGPITERERLIKERFEQRMREKGILMPRLSNFGIDDISEDSIYESFSTESKYDSFDDSLNEGHDLNPMEAAKIPINEDLHPEKNDLDPNETDLNAKEINVSEFLNEQVNVDSRKLQADKRNLVGHFCDSLEDIHSLVSSGDKFSLSEEIEDINIMEISHAFDDSLRNDNCIASKNSNSFEHYDSLMNDVCPANKNSISHEQYFDEDSLAIVENEKAFDDSLEDSNGPSLSYVDSLLLSKGKDGDGPCIEIQNTEKRASKTFFETSIDVIYENSKEIHADNQILNMDRNSPSLSECGNLSSDSLEDISNNSDSKQVSDRKSIHSKKLPKCSTKDLHEQSSKSNQKIDSCKFPSDVTDCGLSAYKVITRKCSTEFLKPLNLPDSSNAIAVNETICIDDSILPSDSSLYVSASDGIASVIKSPKNIASKNQNDSRLSLKPQNSNDTIWIDDSIVLPSESSLHSCATNYLSFESKRDGEDLGCIEVETHDLIMSKPAGVQNYNDTICIEDSIMEDSFAVFGPSNILPIENSGELIRRDLINKPNVKMNETFYIEGSFDLPPEPCLRGKNLTPAKSKATKKKSSSSLSKSVEKEFQKLKINDGDKKLCVDVSHSPNRHSAKNTVIDIVVRSPLHEYKKSGIVELPNLKDKTISPAKVSSLKSATPNEKNMKLRIEVAIDDNQGVNVVSVSSSELGSVEEFCAYPKVDRPISSEAISVTSDMQDRTNVEVSNHIKKINDLESVVTDSPTKKSLKRSSGAKKSSLGIKKCVSDKKTERKRHSNDLDVKLRMHDASLLQALDLHDTSINLSQCAYLQSRDSIMPLNLCIKDKPLEKRKGAASRNESKENIPFISSTKYNFRKEFNIPNNQLCKNSPKKNRVTPLKKDITKQYNNINEVKKSGSKINSATKIPIRKVDNTQTTIKKQMLDFKPNSNTDKPIKSLFLTPCCSAVPQKDVSGETPKKNHHFCMVRNSISKVPKSAQKNTAKKYLNIESPVAKNLEPAAQVLKTPKSAVLPAAPNSTKSDKKF